MAQSKSPGTVPGYVSKGTEDIARSLTHRILEQERDEITESVSRIIGKLTDPEKTVTTDDVKALDDSLDSLELFIERELHALCEYCGMSIVEPGQACPALDDGVCSP